MKKIIFGILAFSQLCLFSCEKVEPETQPLEVSVSIDKSDISSISFVIKPGKATECSYFATEKENIENLSDVDYIFKNGDVLTEMIEQSVTIDNLKPETEYYVAAAVKDANGNSGVSSMIKIKTFKDAEVVEMIVTVEAGEVTNSTISFTITPINAGECKYLVYKKTEGMEIPDAEKVMYIGDAVSVLEPTTVIVDDLLDNTTYIVYGAVKSGSNYDRVAAKPVEMKTKEFPAPEELPMQSYTSGSLDVFGYRKYIPFFENQDYSVEISLIGAETPDYIPLIPNHEYTFIKEYNNSVPWSINKITTIIIDKSSNKTLVFNRGSITTNYKNGMYTIEGRLITNDNKAFNFEFNGSLRFPITSYLKKGFLTVEGGLNKVDFIGDNYYEYQLHFNEMVATGEYSLANGKLNASSYIKNSNNVRYSFSEASVIIDNKYDRYYYFKTTATTTEGYLVYIESEADFDDVILPEISEYTLTEANGLSVEDGTGFGNLYAVEFKSEGLIRAYINFHNLGTLTELPTSNYIYNPTSDFGIGTATSVIMSVSADESYKFVDNGTVKVTKEGSVYTILVSIPISDNRTFKARYVGEIPMVKAPV